MKMIFKTYAIIPSFITTRQRSCGKRVVRILMECGLPLNNFGAKLFARLDTLQTAPSVHKTLV